MALLVLFAFFHPIHISVCEVNFVENSRTFQFSQRIFVDDLEAAINKANGSTIDILKLESKGRDQLLEKYFMDKTLLKADTREIVLRFLGSEIEEGVCWIYYESGKVDFSFTHVSIKNVVLFELYEDQSTILQVKKDDAVKSFRLFADKPEEVISF